jgi:hypothetical protein
MLMPIKIAPIIPILTRYRTLGLVPLMASVTDAIKGIRMPSASSTFGKFIATPSKNLNRDLDTENMIACYSYHVKFANGPGFELLKSDGKKVLALCSMPSEKVILSSFSEGILHRARAAPRAL